MKKYRLEDFDYQLDESKIALYPANPRDASNLMVLKASEKKIIHDKFIHIDKYLPEKSLLVLNNTKVIAAKIETIRERDGKKFTILFLSPINKGATEWKILTYPMKKLKEGDILLTLKRKTKITFKGKKEDEGIVSIGSEENPYEIFEKEGKMPLPPYIKREPNQRDKEKYQTIFASIKGSSAAPTAGLHFTKRVFNKLSRKNIQKTFITLHIGRGTFAPVREKEIEKHPIHKEWFSISEKTAEKLNLQKNKNLPICAVGTTSLRAIETAFDKKSGKFIPQSGETNLYIYPPKKVHSCNYLLTNFHLPKSTLLMLVCAFGGYDFIMEAYREALKKDYRFYSYGDAMLIIR